MLDSLVRVSRREKENHFVPITNPQRHHLPLQIDNRDNTSRSAPTASSWGSAEWLALISFASIAESCSFIQSPTASTSTRDVNTIFFILFHTSNNQKVGAPSIPPATHFTVLTEEPTVQLPVDNYSGEVQAQPTGPAITEKRSWILVW